MGPLSPQSGRSWIGKCLLALVIAAGFAGTSYAQQFDAPHEVLRKKNKDKWAAEDKQINERLAALEERFGKKPNIIYILADDVCWGEMGWRGGGKHRGTPTPELDKLAFERMRFWAAVAADRANTSPLQRQYEPSFTER